MINILIKKQGPLKSGAPYRIWRVLEDQDGEHSKGGGHGGQPPYLCEPLLLVNHYYCTLLHKK